MWLTLAVIVLAILALLEAATTVSQTAAVLLSVAALILAVAHFFEGGYTRGRRVP